MLVSILHWLTCVFGLIGACSSIAAQIIYLRRPGAQWFGFGFARYFYGELRRDKPIVFMGSIGGIGATLLLVVASYFLAPT